VINTVQTVIAVGVGFTLVDLNFTPETCFFSLIFILACFAVYNVWIKKDK
jgi:hypothetical protein